jgi:hypothetical protein
MIKQTIAIIFKISPNRYIKINRFANKLFFLYKEGIKHF